MNFQCRSMFCEKYFASRLMLTSAASIPRNIGFSTAQTSCLHVLNDLLIKFLEHLSKELNKIAEMRGGTAEASPEDVVAVLQGMNFSISELSHYLNSVGDFPFLSAMPVFPVERCQENNSDENFTIDMTAALDPAERIAETQRNFPDFNGKSGKELQLSRRTEDTDMDNTVDSLSSPWLDLRQPSRKQSKRILNGNNCPSENKNKAVDNGKGLNNEKGLKSVLSRKGLTLRLLISNANTPPGFFSSRSKIIENSEG